MSCVSAAYPFFQTSLCISWRFNYLPFSIIMSQCRNQFFSTECDSTCSTVTSCSSSTFCAGCRNFFSFCYCMSFCRNFFFIRIISGSTGITTKPFFCTSCFFYYCFHIIMCMYCFFLPVCEQFDIFNGMIYIFYFVSTFCAVVPAKEPVSFPDCFWNFKSGSLIMDLKNRLLQFFTAIYIQGQRIYNWCPFCIQVKISIAFCF